MRLSECKENLFSFAEREHFRRFDGKGTNNLADSSLFPLNTAKINSIVLRKLSVFRRLAASRNHSNFAVENREDALVRPLDLWSLATEGTQETKTSFLCTHLIASLHPI